MLDDQIKSGIEKLRSKTIKLRLVEEQDAKFILSLRLDQRYNAFLSTVDNDLTKQQAWIRKYKLSENSGTQYYFIIERHDNTACGTVRIYDLQKHSFSWGSWILNENKTQFSAIETALLVYKFGFEILAYTKSHFEVLKENKPVISFHNKLGSKKISADENYYYFSFHKKTYQEKVKEFARFIT